MRFFLRSALRFYKLCLSPLLPAACRFAPSCSDYASEALATHGVLKGGALSARRLLSCHPFGRSGFDPVPCREEGRHE